MLQSGHVTFERYCPVIRSTIIDWFLLMWAIQLYSATTLSGLPLLSTDSTYGFLSILFRSSWRPSTKKEKNSWESCWAYPENMGLIELTSFFMLYGEKVELESHHIDFMNLAYVLASLPFVPIMLVLLISFWKNPPRKYSVRGSVFERHCIQLFMKHVFPKLESPTMPLALVSVILISMSLLSSYISAN